MTDRRNVYVASSWRNRYQPDVVQWLRGLDLEVYDFRNPRPGDDGFRWSEIDPDWQQWTPAQYRAPAPCLGEHTHQVAKEIFGLSDEEIADLLVEQVLY